MNFIARLAAAECERNQREPRGERRHEDGRKAFHRPAKYGFSKISHAFVLLQMANVRHEHDAVARRDAEHRDEADERRHRERAAGNENAHHAANERERKIQHDENRIAR